MKRIISAIKYSAFALLVPAFVFAQLQAPPNNFGLPGAPSSRLSTELTDIVRLVLQIVGLIAVGFLIYGGFQYITSSGNAEQTESAKKTIQNAIIGLLVIILSYTIVTVIINAIGPRGDI
ncbi:MAG: pilin [Candidatus Doudnabacteria bacterium]|nr:pilin [Candidatus Doudnabacteria bacterium]